MNPSESPAVVRGGIFLGLLTLACLTPNVGAQARSMNEQRGAGTTLYSILELSKDVLRLTPLTLEENKRMWLNNALEPTSARGLTRMFDR